MNHKLKNIGFYSDFALEINMYYNKSLFNIFKKKVTIYTYYRSY